jgi:hypothetical protein
MGSINCCLLVHNEMPMQSNDKPRKRIRMGRAMLICESKPGIQRTCMASRLIGLIERCVCLRLCVNNHEFLSLPSDPMPASHCFIKFIHVSSAITSGTFGVNCHAV